jgi:hypothetical protein
MRMAFSGLGMDRILRVEASKVIARSPQKNPWLSQFSSVKSIAFGS